MRFSTPAVIIDLSTVEKNVRRMVNDLSSYKIAYRPHIKTHKSIFLAKKQLEAGAVGITCAKLGEAEVMAEAGFEDITIAYPLIGEDKLARYAAISEKVPTLRTIINSMPGAMGLSELGVKLKKTFEVLVEVDGGMNRGGRKPFEDTVSFVREVSEFKGIKVVGLLYFNSTIYNCASRDHLLQETVRERDEIVGTAKMLHDEGYPITILSGGSSFSSKMPQQLQGLTEARSGNSIFNDQAQLAKGIIDLSDCALRVMTTVIARPDEYHAIIDAGSKALSSDAAVDAEGYGYIEQDPSLVLYAMNEEHGYIRSPMPLKLEIGETLTIIPNHACQILNLFEKAYCVRDGELEKVIYPEARGKLV